jgi:SAM-dependent methyltransferase
MDAENLTFPENRFDVIFPLYALRLFLNPSRALAEMYRVLKPGGKIVVAVGSGPRLMSFDGITAIFRKISSLARKRWARADAVGVDQLRTEFNRRSEAVLEKNGRLVYQTGAAIGSGMKSAYQ